MVSGPRVFPERLIDFATAVYASQGIREPDARLVADTLVQADLWGHPSRGVLRLGWYLDRLRNGVMKPQTTAEFVVAAGAVAGIDGHCNALICTFALLGAAGSYVKSVIAKWSNVIRTAGLEPMDGKK